MIIYDNEFQNLIPPLDDAEYEGLESSLKEVGYDGRLGKIIFWKQDNGDEIVIDGYTRIEICTRLKIKIGKENKQYIDFKDRDDAKDFIIRSHYRRRNMVNICQDDMSLEEIESRWQELDIKRKRNYAECDILMAEMNYLEHRKKKIHINALVNDDNSKIDHKMGIWNIAGMVSYHVDMFLHNDKLREQIVCGDRIESEKPPREMLSKYPERIQKLITEAWESAYYEAGVDKRHRERERQATASFNSTVIPHDTKKEFIRVLLKNYHPDNQKDGTDGEAIRWVNKLKEEWSV